MAAVQINNVKKNIEIKNKILKEELDPTVVSLKNDIKVIKKEIKKAEEEQLMNKELLEVGGISESEVENADYDIGVMKNKMQALENQIDNIFLNQELEIEGLSTSLKVHEVQSDNTGIKEGIDKDVLQVEIELAELELQEMKDKLVGENIKENNVIVNEEKSIVQNFDIEVGQKVGTEQRVICTLVPVDDLVGVINVPQAFVSQIKKGSKATMSGTGNSENLLQGEVTDISEYAFKENGENMVAVTVEIPKEQDILKLGYEINVTFNLE